MAGRRTPARRAGWWILLAITCGVALPAIARPVVPVTQSDVNPIARELRDRVGGKFREVYRARGYWPMWVDGDALGPQAAALIEVIDSVGVDGLDPDRYDLGRLREIVATTAPGDTRALVYAEVAFSSAFADLVRDMREPRVRLRYLEKGLEPARVTPADALRRAALAPSLASYVRQLGWMNPIYFRLREALAYADSARGDARVAVPAGPALREGSVDARVALLRARLGLGEPARDESAVFDDALTARVRGFQAAHGLPVDGVVGARTLAALAGDASMPDRRALLHVNLERARLLPDAWTRHVVVDAASARLWYFGGGAEQGTMRVVAGTPDTQTPMMAGTIRYATLNPYWNVPVDLVRQRIAPQVMRGRSLASLGYEALSGFTADARVIDPATIDWRAVVDGTVEPRVRELPGRGNSMGSMKFMFPNPDGIYLHDTPQRALFTKPDRHFSNGCVRLEDAARLGRWLYGQPLKPDGAAAEQHLALADPVPVYLMYFTASPLDEGVIYVADSYGRDGEQLRRLASR